MTPFSAIVAVTLRGLLGRRRLFLMLAPREHPGPAGRRRPGPRRSRRTWSGCSAILVVQTVMPLVALILGTASLGSEIEDGTAVYLLTKPIRRWLVALAKIVVAVGVTAAARRAGHDPDRPPGRRRRARRARRPRIAFAVACLAGGAAYAAVFVALSTMTGRALDHRPRLRAGLGGGAGRAARGDPVPLDPPGDARDRGGPRRRGRTDAPLQIGRRRRRPDDRRPRVAARSRAGGSPGSRSAPATERLTVRRGAR